MAPATPIRHHRNLYPGIHKSVRNHPVERHSPAAESSFWQAFADIKALLADKPLVLDREFSYQERLHCLCAAGLNFVVRRNLRSQPPKLYTAEGREVVLAVGLGQKEVYHQLRYKGKVTVNVIGVWRYGMPEPMWVMSNLQPEEALRIYHARMKIDESFKDLKNLLGLDKLMNKSQEHMEQIAALTMIAYAVGLLVGETLRDELYGSPPPTDSADPLTVPAMTPVQRKWKHHSGLFMLLKQKLLLTSRRLRQLVNTYV
jgi:hypothetical protein